MKPEVKYKHIKGLGISKGRSAIVFPLNHPNPHGLVSNTKPILTSKVVAVRAKTKTFETLNTIYVYDGEYDGQISDEHLKILKLRLKASA